ncbi:hypothetical protein [Shinella sp.]
MTTTIALLLAGRTAKMEPKAISVSHHSEFIVFTFIAESLAARMMENFH